MSDIQKAYVIVLPLTKHSTPAQVRASLTHWLETADVNFDNLVEWPVGEGEVVLLPAIRLTE